MKKKILTQTDINSQVLTLCRDIANSGWMPDYIIGITRGGLVPAVMISHYFNVPLHTLKVSLRDKIDTETNLWMAEEAFGYESLISTERYTKIPKNILIVDDINDTGATFQWLMNDWRSGCMPYEQEKWCAIWHNNVRFATIVENLSSEVATDYNAVKINKAEEDVWFIFPWESWWSI